MTNFGTPRGPSRSDWGIINQASSEAADGPGISNEVRNTERRKDARNQRSERRHAPGGCHAVTGGGILTRPHQRPRTGRVFRTKREIRKGERTPGTNEVRDGMPLGAVTQ